MSEMEKVSGHTASAEKSLHGFGMSAVYLNEGLELAKKGLETVKKVLEATVFKFLEGQEHTKRLSNALKLMGNDSVKETTEHFKRLGEEMTNLTGVQNESVEDMARIGVTMGLNTEQIDRYIRAAADASAATGMDMTSAFEIVTQSLKGQTRGLASIIPQIKNFTEEQAKAGKAADYFAERMKGFAGANADNFSVTMKKNAVALEYFQKAIGSVMAEVLNLGGGKSVIGDILTSARSLVDEYHSQLVGVGKGIIDFFTFVSMAVTTAIAGLAASFAGVFGELLSDIGSLTGSGAIKGAADSLKSFADTADGVMTQSADYVLGMKSNFEGVAKAAKAANDVLAKTKLAAPIDPKILAQLAEYEKALGDIQKKTDELNLAAKESGMTQLEILDEQLKMINKVIDAKERALDADIKAGKYSPQQGAVLKGALEAQRGAEGAVIDSKKAQAPGQEYEAAIIAGKSMTSDLTAAFTSGTAGMALGMLGAVDAFVGVAQGIVDFIPKLLEKIAGLFDSITDLPNKLVSSIGHVFNSIINFTANFIPNVLKAIPKILNMAMEFARTGLPNAVKSLAKAVPVLIYELINALPDIVEGLVEGLVSSMPEMVISLIESIIKMIPKVATTLMKVLFIQIPLAIIKGIVDGVKNIGKAIGGMFNKVKVIDSADIGKAVADIKKLTGAASEMFNVKDLANNIGEQAQTQAQQLGDAVKKGMDEAIKMLIGAWRYIYDRIIMPIINGFKEVFSAFGTALKGLWDQLADMFSNIGTAILDGVKGGISGLATMFQGMFDALNPENLFNKMFNTDKASGQGTVESALGIDIPFLNFATGGTVPGAAKVAGDSLLNDRVLAMLSPGEAIIPRSLMADKHVKAVVDSILSGQMKVPQFAYGVKDFKKDLEGAGSAVSSAWDGATSGGNFGNLDPRAQAAALKKAGERALEMIRALATGSPWKVAWEKVQEMTMKMFEHNRFESGGLVTGASGVDTIPARLTSGEFVMNKNAVGNIGIGNLNRMNSGGTAAGGGSTITNEFNIKIEAKGNVDEAFVRQRLMSVIKDELRRASLDGERMLSIRGVR